MGRTRMLDRARNFTRISAENIIDPATDRQITKRASRVVTKDAEVAAPNNSQPSTGGPDISRQQGPSSRNFSENTTGSSSTFAFIKLRRVTDQAPTVKTRSRRQGIRHDPMTRKGRDTSKGKSTATPNTSPRKVTRMKGKNSSLAAPLTPAKAGELLEKARQMNGEVQSEAAVQRNEPPRETQVSKQGQSASSPWFTTKNPGSVGAPRNDSGENRAPRRLPTDGEEMDMTLAAPSDGSTFPKDDRDLKANDCRTSKTAAPSVPSQSASDTLDSAIDPFQIHEDMEAPGRLRPSEGREGSHPISIHNVPVPEDRGSGTTDQNWALLKAENLRRAATGQPPVSRSGLSTEVVADDDEDGDDDEVDDDGDAWMVTRPYYSYRSPSAFLSLPGSKRQRRRSHRLQPQDPRKGSGVILPLLTSLDRPQIKVTPPLND